MSSFGQSNLRMFGVLSNVLRCLWFVNACRDGEKAFEFLEEPKDRVSLKVYVGRPNGSVNTVMSF